MAFTGRTPGGKPQEGVRALSRRSFVNPHNGSRPGSMPGLTSGDRWTGQRSHLGGVPAECERRVEYRRYTHSHARRRVPATRSAWASFSVRPSPFRPPSKPDPGRKPAILPLRLLRRLSPWCTKSSSTTVLARRKNRIADLQRSGMEIVFGDPEDRPCELLPPEAFPAPEDIRPDPEVRRRGGTSDEETGRNSRAVYWRFFSSCAGWPCPPTPGEFYDAIREENPNRRQRTVLRTWFPRGHQQPKFSGVGSRKRIRGPCSWPAIHRVGYRRNALNHYLNGFAKRRNPRFVDPGSAPSSRAGQDAAPHDFRDDRRRARRNRPRRSEMAPRRRKRCSQRGGCIGRAPTSTSFCRPTAVSLLWTRDGTPGSRTQ